jgi:phosphohistidine phosphatase SixA
MKIIFVRHANFSEIHQVVLPDYLPLLDRLGKKLAGLLGRFTIVSSNARRAVETAHKLTSASSSWFNDAFSWEGLSEYSNLPIPELLEQLKLHAVSCGDTAVVAVTHGPRLRAIHDHLTGQSADSISGRGLGYAEAYVLDLDEQSIKKLGVRHQTV